MVAAYFANPDGHGFASIQDVRIAGGPGVGRYRLNVTVSLTPEASSRAPFPWVRQLHGEITLGSAVVGHLVPCDIGWRSFPGSTQASDVVLSVLLDAPTILALDRARGPDGSLLIGLWLRALVEDADMSMESRYLLAATRREPQVRDAIKEWESRASFPAPYPGALTTTYTAIVNLYETISASDFTRILREMQWEERALLEVPVGGDRVDARSGKAGAHLKEALKQVELRQWPQALVACREALDELDRLYPVATPPSQEWGAKQLRDQWDLGNRVALARWAIRHATHVGAHQKLGPTTEQEARLLVHLTAALVADAVR